MSSCYIRFASFLVAALARNSVCAEPPTPKDGPLGMKVVRLPKGTFYMGGGGGRAGKTTEIKADFEIAIHTVTQGQWQTVMGNNPSGFSHDGIGMQRVRGIADADLKQLPVERVSWNGGLDLINKGNEKERGKSW